MFDKIYDRIKKYNNIVIVRHIGADPDSLSSQIALRESIRLTFPKKKILCLGNTSVKFNYFPKLDKFEELDDVLLIVVDTPDRKRVDFSWNINVVDSIKIDHHPFIEEYCNLEYIDDSASSAAQIILEMINSTPLKMNDEIASIIYTGILSDTNRFMFNSSSKLFGLVSELLKKYKIDTNNIYSNLYTRPINEIKLQGYIAQNFVVTENGFAYVKIFNDILNDFSVDVGSAGNLINGFNYMENIFVWAVVTEDVKNNLYKVNIRSRGPVINTVAEKYNGGGHKLASGARVDSMDNVDLLIKDLDSTCKKWRSKYENK